MNVTRLAAQILKLREAGYIINTETVQNGKVAYARYHLVSAP